MQPGRQGADGQQDGAAPPPPPGWAVADDVFQQRYQAGAAHMQGSWQPLPQLSLQLDAAAPAPASAAGRRSGGSAAAAAPQQEPWLLAAGAYAAEAGAGWQGGAKAARARMLFQYKPYSQQEPLSLGEGEVAAVVEAVFGRMGGAGPSAFGQDEAASLWDSHSHGARFGLSSAATTGEVAAVILVKLVMDLYVSAGPKAAFPLALLLLQKPLLSGDPAVQCRVFDLLYNLSIHGELLYDTAAEAVPEDAPALADAVAELDLGSDPGGASANWRATVTSAFRATLAATMRASPGAFDGAAAAACSGGGGGGLRGSVEAGSGAHHTPTRSSLDGRSLRGSVDAGRTSLPTLARLAAGGGAASSGAAGGSSGEWPPLLGQRPAARCPRGERFQQWLRLLLFQLMGGLVAASAGSAGGGGSGGAGAGAEGPWVAALSCLLHLCSHEGRLVRACVEDLPLSVVAAMLEQCRRHCWSEQLHAWLVSLAANLLYVHVDAEEYGVQRSVKAVSLRSDGAGSAAGSVLRASYGGQPAGELSWWAASQLDLERLAAFGGMRHVLQCFREAPTVAARRSMFAVLYDYVVAGQKPSSRDSWAPVLMHTAHSSETAALGAALLHMGAAEAVHPLFLAGMPGTMQPVADAVSMQMAALQAANPGRVVSAPAAMVTECMECLEEIATNDMQVPAPLQEAVKLSLEAVTAPEAGSGSLSDADARAMWGCLADCMRDGSELGSRAGRGWLLKLLVAAAEQELGRAGAGNGAASSGGEQQQEQQEGGAGGRAQSPAVTALLPEVSAHGSCLQSSWRGMQGQDGLRELLMRALATTPDSQAADCFVSAVGSLLAHIRLRRAAAAWEQEDGWAGPGEAAGADMRTPLASSASGALKASGSASRLSASASQRHTPGSASASPSPHVRGLSQLPPAPSADSLPDAETSAVRVMPSDSMTSGAQSSPYEGQGGIWRNLPCSEVVLATLSLAVEWLLQAPQESRQGGMLRATHLLLAFTLSTPASQQQQQQQKGGGLPALNAGANGQGGLLRGLSALVDPSGQENAQPGASSPAVSPARWGGGTPQLQHRLSGQAPAPLQIPPSPDASPSAPELLSPPGLPPRPISPNLAALKAAASSAAASSAASSGLRPATPRASSFERLQAAGGEPSAVDIASAAAAAARGGAGGTNGLAERLEEAAAAASEAHATLLWTFLNGGAVLPQDLLRLIPPLLLRTLFEDLKPDSSALHYDALAAAGAGASASRLTRAADAALGVKATVQADRPLWDARAAVLLLLMARCAADAAALRALGGTAFFSSLLGEPDVRVRHYASVFVLRQLMLQQPLQYRRALRGVVARAQSANDEKLLTNPYLQLKAMLDQGKVHLEEL